MLYFRDSFKAFHFLLSLACRLCHRLPFLRVSTETASAEGCLLVPTKGTVLRLGAFFAGRALRKRTLIKAALTARLRDVFFKLRNGLDGRVFLFCFCWEGATKTSLRRVRGRRGHVLDTLYVIVSVSVSGSFKKTPPDESSREDKTGPNAY